MVLFISAIISLSFLMEPAPIPYARPGSRNKSIMKKIIPLMNGELKKEWVSGLRTWYILELPLVGTTSDAMKSTYTTAVIPAKRIPRFSFSAISCTCSDASGTYGVRRGSTSLSVTSVPMAVIRNVDAIMKNQFATGKTV